MGEVYKARDTRLGRDVALKLLPPHLISSTEARVRFEREARVISQLNHPGICTLYDIGRDGDRDFLVLEFIPGDTLGARLSQGPLPFGEVLTFGVQIADALAKAHELGIVHRDLKPGNLMLTSSGIKLLDFGLSHPATAMSGDQSLSSPETTDLPVTSQGEFVGTLAYMAPEQIAGNEVDGRTDIFALGCVLFEMATGKRLFGGATSAAILSSIVQDSSDLSTKLTQQIPPQFVRIIERCLQRDPGARYGTAAELRDALIGVRDWGQKDALPELTSIIGRIQSLDEGPEAWQAFELGRQIEQIVQDDPQLERLWPEFTREISIITEPAGAQVSIKYYGQPDSAWIPLGKTPLEKIRFPRGFTRLRIERAGYRPVDDVLWAFEMAVVGATDPATATWVYPLTRSGDVPAEMELIPAGHSSLFMPGLDHLESEPTASFLMDRDPVTNREFKRFVDAGGYRQTEYWH
ncbi:MAG TPA: protein kinase, partial [candidate division Zixibacteria bacterium]|nr:protein kinase [candidate division Zixibacteria bacterium]